MKHCLNKRIRHETFTNEQEEVEAELQTWNGRTSKERKSDADKRRRAAVKQLERWKAHIEKHQQYKQ